MLSKFPDGLIGLHGSYNSKATRDHQLQRDRTGYPGIRWAPYEADDYNAARDFVQQYNKDRLAESKFYTYHIVQRGAPLNPTVLKLVGTYKDPAVRDKDLAAFKADNPLYQFAKLDTEKGYNAAVSWVNLKNLKNPRLR